MLDLKDHFLVNNSEIAAKVFDGEVILINLSTSGYYSMDNVGGFIWEMIGKHYRFGEIIESVVALYQVPNQKSGQDIEYFIMTLTMHGIISVTKSQVPGSLYQKAVVSKKLHYKVPKLNIHSEFVKLLALDPPLPRLRHKPSK